MRYGGILVLLAVWLGLAGSVGGAESGEATPLPPSTAYRLTLQKFMNGQDDLVVTLFVREGRPCYAFAQTPGIDQALHRVDISPAAPMEFLLEGQKYDPPEKFKSSYNYKNAEFLKYRALYEQGKIVMRNYDAPPALSIAGDRATGVLDLFLDRSDHRNRDVFRIQVDIKARGEGAAAGTYSAFNYDAKDESFAPVGDKVTGSASLDPIKDFAAHTPDRAFAKGSDWPQQHGPMLNGSAVDCQRDLVDNLADARLMWVADMPIPGGRGGIPRSAFGFHPINNSGLGLTQFSAPIVADGKVYLAVPYPDAEGIGQAEKELRKDPRVIRGLDPRALADELGLLRDTLICIDAQTGQVLWMFQDPRKMGLLGESKSGRGLTAVYHDGKVIFRGQLSLYCVNAQTGQLLWQNNGQKAGKKAADPGYSFGTPQPWSTDHSPVVIGGVVVVRINDTPKADKKAPSGQPAEYTSLMGFDPATGKPLWRASNVTGRNAIATSIVLEGKTYIIAAYSGADELALMPPDQVKPGQRGMLSLIEPATGRIVWQKPVTGPTSSYPLVWEDIVALNVERERLGKGNKDKPVLVPNLGAVRVGLADASVIWNLPKVDWQDGRQTPIAHHGVFIQDSRDTGFQAFDARTGKILGTFPHIYNMAYGSHNWTWTIASNDRIFTSGAYLLMFRLKDGQMELKPGSLPVDLASGYMCPIRPAIADGRLFVRTGDGLACYDLRRPPGKHVVDTIALTTQDLALGMARDKAGADLQIRMVNGDPQSTVLRYPAFQNTGVPRPYAWGGTNAMRWRSAGASGLAAEGNRIHGEVWVRVNEQEEPWKLDLVRDGGKVTGTAERSIPAASAPMKVQGAAEVTTQVLDDKRTRWSIRLAGAAINVRGGAGDVTLYIEKLPDGTLLSYAGGGRINQASFEVDASALKIDDKAITGPTTVLFHSDRYGAIRPDLATALAATYTVDVTATKNEKGELVLSGTYTGEVGVEYRRAVPVAGQYLAGQDLRVGVDANAVSAPAGDADEGDKD